MKKSRIYAVLCLILSLVFVFSACHFEIGDYAIGIVDLNDIRGENVTDGNNAVVTDPNNGNVILPEITTVPSQDNPQSPGANIQVDNSYKEMPMSSYDVIELYKRATGDVKARAPGYMRSKHQEISDVEGGDGTVPLINRVLNLVGTEVLKNSGDEEESIQIMAHDDIAVRETFPLYNKDVGCELTDMSIVKSAVCYSDGATYKIVITFDDQLNPDPETSPFAGIMTPIDRDVLSDPIEEYLVVLDMNSYKFDLNYTNCEITCIIDKATSRMTSLKHKLIMDVDIEMNLDLILFQTNNVKASGRIVTFLEYYNFDWS